MEHLRNRTDVRRVTEVAVVGLCLVFLAAGCSAGRKGGDTTCAEFNKLNKNDQSAAISQMLKDQDGKEASNLEVAATRLSASAFCKTLGRDSSRIKDIDTG